MGGSNPNNAPELSAMKSNSGMNNDVLDFQATRPWQIQSTQSEKIAEGIGKGIGSLAGGVASKFASHPNATGGYNSQLSASVAAPHAAGYNNVDGIGWVPRAQGVNYQPDQFARMYGYNYRGTGA
jgi:hypothetical protein